MPRYRITIETREKTYPPFEMDLDPSLPVREVIHLLSGRPELVSGRGQSTYRSYHLLGGAGRTYLSSEQQIGQTVVAGGGDLFLVQDTAPWSTSSATDRMGQGASPSTQPSSPTRSTASPGPPASRAPSSGSHRLKPASPRPHQSHKPAYSHQQTSSSLVLAILGVVGVLAVLVSFVLFVLSSGDTATTSNSRPESGFSAGSGAGANNVGTLTPSQSEVSTENGEPAIAATATMQPTSTAAPTNTPIPPTHTPRPRPTLRRDNPTSTPPPSPTRRPSRPPPPTSPPQAARVVVPDVVGQTAEQARNAIRARGFAIAENWRASQCDTPFYVIAQTPAGGQTYNEGGTVTISICPQVVVPNVIGMQRDAAAVTLRNAGLRVGVVEEPNRSMPEGQVWATSPGPGSSVGPGTVVIIRVYTHEQRGISD